MSILEKLATGERIVYVATRLFDYSEKIKAEDMEAAVLSGIASAMADAGMPSTGTIRRTFVPFRDTVQNVTHEPVQSIPNLNKAIFEEDIRNLTKSVAIVAHFDGLSKDEGVGIEIGYAYGLGIPILLATTDFVRSDFKRKPRTEHQLDPVVEFMATSRVHRHEIPECGVTYRDKLHLGLNALYSDIAREFRILCLSPPIESRRLKGELGPTGKVVCLDFGGGQFEWQVMMAAQVSELLQRRGYSPVITDRYSNGAKLDAQKESVDLGRADVEKVEGAAVLITCSDMLEMNSGTAALQGYGRCLGKSILLYDSKVTDMVGDNRYRSSRNLMVDHSADISISSLLTIPDCVDDLFSKM